MANRQPDRPKTHPTFSAQNLPLDLPPDFPSLSEGDTKPGDEKSLETSFEEIPDPTKISEGDNQNSTIDNMPSIQGYSVERKLGQGGMGSVFLAKDLQLNRQVAIKVISLTFQKNTGLRDRFEAEIKTLAGLHHSNIAQLFSAGTYQDLPFFVMEFVDGPTLETYAQKPLSAKESTQIVSKLCSAVSYCHQNRVLHRDLKPANVILDPSNEPKIADFGLAKAIGNDSSSTKTGEIIGTPGYMAPEQASGVVKSFTETCDIYALGAILYRLMTGRPPFAASEPLQVVMQVLTDEPITPKKLVSDIPIDLQTICLKCLEKNSAKRYQTAEELKDDLQRFLDGRPIKARAAGFTETAVKWTKRNPVKAFLACSVAVLAIALATGLSWHNQILSAELAKTKRLADHGSELTNWLITEHIEKLNKISGTTKPRLALAQRVKEFLDASNADIPADAVYKRNLGNSYARFAAVTGGEDNNNLGNKEQAIEFYQKAIQLYDQSLELDSTDAKTKRFRTNILLELSETYLENQDPKSSQRYLELAENSIPSVSKSWESLFLSIMIENRKARDFIGQYKFAEALQHLDKVEQKLDQADPNSNPPEQTHQRIRLAANRGICYSNLGKFEKADSFFLDSIKQAEAALKKESENILAQKRLSSCLERLANSLFSQQKVEQSLKYYSQAKDIAKKIVDADPDNLEASLALAVKYSNISDAYFYLQNNEQAKQNTQKAIDLFQKFHKAKKLGKTGSRQYSVCLQSQANIFQTEGNTKKALEQLSLHRQFCKDLITEDKNSIFELTQLAENHFSQSLIRLSAWMNQEFDPTKAKESQPYKEINKDLDDSEAYFARIEKITQLSVQQLNFRKRIKAVRALVEETIQKALKTQENHF